MVGKEERCLSTHRTTTTFYVCLGSHGVESSLVG